MKQITTEVFIDAPIEVVWAALLDFQAYPEWNPFIRKIEGKPQVGESLVVTIQPPNQKPMNFYPAVLTAAPYEFSWFGSLWKPGIFDGTHRFILERVGNRVKLIHAETFSGLLYWPVFALIRKSTQAGFESMNAALKQRCEQPLQASA